MSLPRLHPDDLQLIIDNVANNVAKNLEKIFSKKENVSEMQTLTIKDVAKILNRNETTILRYINKKILVASKKGKQWLITKESLNNYING